MKLKSFEKSFLYVLLVLLFCVAVSGGCGGSSSGHYYGNYGNSSQDVVPDNPTSDDEYGVGRPHSFTELNNTEWRINSVSVNGKYRRGGTEYTEYCTVDESSYNQNVSKITLQIFGDDALLWYDGNGMPYGNWTSPLTVKFHDSYGILDTAPILRSSENFDEVINDLRFCRYKVVAGEKDSETISVYYDEYHKTITSINITNVFLIDEITEYESELSLVPYNSTK